MKKNKNQKETVIDPNTSTVTTPRSQVNTDLRRHGMSPSTTSREIHTQLVYGKIIIIFIVEMQQTVHKKAVNK